MIARLFVILVAALGACCGGAWADADGKSAYNAAQLEALGLALCAADDAGCEAPQVRALDRAAFCANASMLARHGEDVPDAGVACRPR